MKFPRKRRWEQSTVGPDANLQLVGSDAQGGQAWLGLPIPSAVPATEQGRYTFLLAVAEFGIGEQAILVGMRQYVELQACISIAQSTQTFPISCVQRTTSWRFVDGNIVWGLRKIRPMTPGFYNTSNADALQWRLGPSPAQLFETVSGAGIILPPYAGAFPGEALEPSLAQFYDLRFPWVQDEAAHIMHCPIEGPCIVALFASVLQTNPATRISMPGTPPFSTATGISREDAFVANFNTCARYGRIAGSLIFEQHEGGPALKPGSEKYPQRDQAPDSALERNYNERH